MPGEAHAAQRARRTQIPDRPTTCHLGPLMFGHGRYPFNRPVLDRPLRDPHRTGGGRPLIPAAAPCE